MKITNSIVIGVVILFTAAIAAPAADTGKKDTTSGNTGSGPKEITIPKDAVPNPDGNTFTYTDKEGKKWLYKKTPFGVMRGPARDEAATTKSEEGSAKTASGAAVSAKGDSTRAIDKGDTVRFERPSPFGPIIWEKKKSELTENERHILEGQTAKTEQK
jgi:hypothetical protein